MALGRYSIGIGDRFARQGKAQLSALAAADRKGVRVTPVWNKSHREHTIVGSTPADVRAEADGAVAALGWKGAYFVDADHVALGNVDWFVDASDFFTLDVADFTGESADESDVAGFVDRHAGRAGDLALDGLDEPFRLTRADLAAIARKYLPAVGEAGRIYRHVAAARGERPFVTEVSMDETDRPQTPPELFFILAAIAEEGIPARTIAPKFTGRFNKGVDYVGDVGRFAREFDADLGAIAKAVAEFDLPADLKLSVHSGSDKFSLYGPMHASLTGRGAGLHLKTAGTTWLEELIGLAAAGADGLAAAKEVYRRAMGRFDEMCRPYAPVIDIDRDRLPPAETVDRWSAEDYVAALRHDPSCEAYDPNVRQLLHVSYKVAAEMGERFLAVLADCESVVAENVRENIYARHVRPLFLGD